MGFGLVLPADYDVSCPKRKTNWDEWRPEDDDVRACPLENGIEKLNAVKDILTDLGTHIPRIKVHPSEGIELSSQDCVLATRMVTLSSESPLGEYWELENKQTSSEISLARFIQIRVAMYMILSAAKKIRRICFVKINFVTFQKTAS